MLILKTRDIKVDIFFRLFPHAVFKVNAFPDVLMYKRAANHCSVATLY